MTENLVFIMSVTLSLGNGIFRTVWGFLFDCFDFKPLMAVSFLLQIICGSAFYFSAESPAGCYILVIITSLIAASSFALIPASVYKKYGTRFGSEVYGAIFFAFGIASIIAPLLSYFLGLSHSSVDTTPNPYQIIYSAGAVTGIIGLILVFLLNTSSFPSA